MIGAADRLETIIISIVITFISLLMKFLLGFELEQGQRRLAGAFPLTLDVHLLCEYP